MSARDIVLSASGNSSGTPVYVDDVFSTYTYTGTGTSQAINTGIDLAGKGGLTWIKQRSGSQNHSLFDTSRGVNNYLRTDSTGAQNSGGTYPDLFTSFNSNGFTLGADASTAGLTNNSGTFASWTFRKQPKFFDVVTYTGNATNPRTISHSLGSVPGMVIIKRTDTTGDWWVYHNGITVSQYLKLNTTDILATSASIWGTGPTSSGFTVNAGAVNTAGATYVAYIYAHNAGGFGTTGTENAISCGTFTTNQSITIGFEPQWILYKDIITAGTSWQIIDNMRGMSFTDSARLFPNSSGTEVTGSQWITPTSTGFITSSSFAASTFIYMAIRRPNKPPTSGTQVFALSQWFGSTAAKDMGSQTNGFGTGYLSILKDRDTTQVNGWFDHLRGNKFLYSDSTATEYADPVGLATVNNKLNVKQGSYFGAGGDGTSRNYIGMHFKRAPGFMDIVCYTGTGVARTVNHNLGVAPELMIVKRRSGNTGEWGIYCSLLVSPINSYLQMNRNISKQTQTNLWSNITTSTFGYGSGNPAWGDFNAPDGTYVAYLFATLAGISKVGSYTGNGTSQTIACGFTTGARFIMIKRTDSTGDWYIWDSARGIVSANDPHLSLNTTVAEVTTDDSVDPDNSGFIVNQVAATNINVTSATYIFLAIA
jgi:hypothetical protein